MIAPRKEGSLCQKIGDRCLPEFYSERLIDLQGPLTAGVSGVTFQNQMTLPFPDHTATCYNVDTETSLSVCSPIQSSLFVFSSNVICRYQYAVWKCLSKDLISVLGGDESVT